MDELEWLRKQINDIDEVLIDFFKKRMEVVRKVADYKIKNSMKVLDRSREEEIINKYLKDIESEDLKGSVKEFLEDIMCISRSAQRDMLSKSNSLDKVEYDEKDKVGFQGVPASFSHQALNEYFGKDIETSYFSTFEDVFEALKKGSIKYGVLPIENSSTGGIAEVYDLLRNYGFYIVGEQCIKVDHNLLAVEGTKISDIKEVYSHTQGFLQCSKFFDENSNWTLIPYYNTAKSAEYISKEKSKHKACVASKKAAEVYNLNILKENINYNINNHTRFIIIGRELENDSTSNKISVVINLPHKAGSLNSILKHFAENGLNMMKIESRPIESKSWQYFFYIDFEGNIKDANTKNALECIEKESLHFKLLGNYKDGN